MTAASQAAAAFEDESGRYERIPAKLEQRLMAFQREGVKFVLRRGGRGLIGDEMGLGKTVQVCFNPNLICNPRSSRLRPALHPVSSSKHSPPTAAIDGL